MTDLAFAKYLAVKLLNSGDSLEIQKKWVRENNETT